MPERPSIPTESIRDLKERIDLRDIAAQFTTLSGQAERVGPCPRCGGVDRFHVRPQMFFCRQCYPAEQHQGRHDIYDFARFVGLAHNFREAYQIVADWSNQAPSPVRPILESAPKVDYRTEAWQQAARSEVERSHQLLLSPQGKLGHAYLAGRMLRPETWVAAKLGLSSRLNASGSYGWAIALPWVYQDQITAIQYRFIEPQQQRYMRFSHQKSYGETLLYSLPAKQANTLVIVEGELNALSVWQETPWDAISFGSENMTLQTLEALQGAVQPYPRVLVWADKPAVVEHLSTHLGRSVEQITSDYDANDLLQREQLRTFLA
jgi:hypothetical protein